MTVTGQQTEQQAVALLAELAKAHGMTLTPAEQPQPSEQKPSTDGGNGNGAKHRTQLPDGASTKNRSATVNQTPPNGGNGKARKPSKYGQAPVVEQPGEGRTQAQRTHDVRIKALENALPGLCKVAYVFSVGKNAQMKFEKNLALCINNPFTWIELPGGKEFTLPGLTAQQIRDTIKKCGYGYSPKNQLWVTKSDGYPANARWAGCREIGRAMVNVETD